METTEKIEKILDGMLNFNGDTRAYMENVDEKLDGVLDLVSRRYSVTAQPIVSLPINEEARRLTDLLKPELSEIYGYDSPDGFNVVGRTYVLVRGDLPSGKTVRVDSSRCLALFLNGVRRTEDYTFRGEREDSTERVTVLLMQTKPDYTVRPIDYGRLVVGADDLPLKNAEIFLNVSNTRVQLQIGELLAEESCAELYIRGDYIWETNALCPIRTLTATGDITMAAGVSWFLPYIENLYTPNVINLSSGQASLRARNADLENVSTIGSSYFNGSMLRDDLYLPKVITVGESAFNNAKFIKSIYIGDLCKSINAYAFSNCISAESLHLGKNITSIAKDYQRSFGSLTSLKKLTVSEGYNAPTLEIQQSSALDWQCFSDVLTNVADRTGQTQGKFKVSSTVLTRLASAQEENDPAAVEIYRLMAEKNWLITT